MIVGEPVQVPFVVVSTCPSRAVPETAGMTVFVGGTAVMTALCVVVEDVEPAAFVAVTVPRIVLPTSVAVRVYVVPVCPAIVTQLEPAASQRCQDRA